MPGRVTVSSSLFLLPNVLSGRTDVQANLRALGAKWQRTIGLQWGPLVGTFRIEGEENVLAGYMNNWLGMHLEERLGRETWSGIVVDLTLRSRVVRRRSLGNVWNRVREKHGNLLDNSGFENNGTSPNTFANWIDSIDGAGTITAETTLANVASGSQSAKITTPGAGNSTKILQSWSGGQGNVFRVSFKTRGDGVNAGRYQISAGITSTAVISTNVASNVWKRITEEVAIAEGDPSPNLLITLFGPNVAGSAYFDDVEIRRLEDGQPVPTYTPYSESVESINAFGKREWTIDQGETRPSGNNYRLKFLGRHAWPKLERLDHKGSDVPVLEGVAIGYGLTTDWVFAQHEMFGASEQASTLMETFLSEAEYIDAITVYENTETVRLDMNAERRLRQSIEEVVAQGNRSDYWHIYIARGRRAIYKPINFSPKYYLQDGELRSSLNGPVVDPHLVVPGIVRDVSYPRGADYPDSPYQDRRDFLMEEVTVKDGQLERKVGDFER